MSRLLKSIEEYAASQPQAIALEGMEESLDYGGLLQAVRSCSAELQRLAPQTVALLMDNVPAVAVIDLACLHAALPLVPMPLFFSPAQSGHLLRQSGAELLITDMPEQVEGLLQGLGRDYIRLEDMALAGSDCACFRLNDAGSARFPADTAKVTFTSGSTGEPKGACLTMAAMEAVADSLRQATAAHADDRHLTVLPYATLLENIGGIYVPLLAGATVVMPGLKQIGLAGATGLDPQRFVTALTEYRASSCIMIPQMLQALVAMVAAGLPKPATLRFAAVGGAPVAETLLARADALALPVFEGYGLSEAASVVAVNRPDARRIGSVGKPLPHVELRFAEDGEILVRGSLFSGYMGNDELAVGEFWPTGDVGYLDDEGFLHLAGRKKHMFITAFGRNVSPEWVEREMMIEPAIGQVCIFGEARPFNVAVIVPRPGFDQGQVEAAVAAANARLPDYARVGQWIAAGEPFSVENGQWTGTGRPRREHIFRAYLDAIEALYQEN
jgi:long-subunit acyl-CoA synthetase (AMP-forming)